MTEIEDIQVEFLTKHEFFNIGQTTWMTKEQAETLAKAHIVKILGKTRYTWDELKLEPKQKIEYILDGKIKIPKDGLVIIGAKHGTFKSWLAQVLSNSISTGTSFLNIPVLEKGTVLYIDEELRKTRFIMRQNRIIAGMGKRLNFPDNIPIYYVDDEGYHIINADLTQRNNRLRFKQLEKLIVQTEPLVVIMDSFSRFTIGNENSSEDMKRIYTNLKPLFSRYGCTFIILAHLAKDAKKDPTIRGSGDIIAQVDDAYLMEKMDSNTYSIVSGKFRDDVDEDGILFQVQDIYDDKGEKIGIDILVIGDVPNAKSPTLVDTLTDELTEWIKNHPKFTTKEVAEYFKQYKDKIRKQSIKRLIMDGKISRVATGKYEITGN